MKHNHKHIHETIKSNFPAAVYNETTHSYDVVLPTNKNDKWDAPEALTNFDNKFGNMEIEGRKPAIAGTSWDNAGNVSIQLRNYISKP